MGRTAIHGGRRLARLSRPQALRRLSGLRRRHRARRPPAARAGQVHRRPQRYGILLPVPPQLSHQTPVHSRRSRPLRRLHHPGQYLVPDPRRRNPQTDGKSRRHALPRNRPEEEPLPLRALPRSLGIARKNETRPVPHRQVSVTRLAAAILHVVILSETFFVSRRIYVTPGGLHRSFGPRKARTSEGWGCGRVGLWKGTASAVPLGRLRRTGL